jgi:hypothetical protein
VSAITDALDRMDFWSRVIVINTYEAHLAIEAEYPLDPAFDRIRTVIATTQFQAAQEAAREAQV